MRNLATVPEFDAGGVGGRMISRGLGSESFGVMGVYSGSTLEALQSVSLTMLRRETKDETTGKYAVNVKGQRGLFPVPSRLEQVTGREIMFVGSGKQGFLGKNKIIDAGATSRIVDAEKGTSRMVNQNVEWAESVTGGTNKLMIMDVKEGNKLFDALAGSGAAYHQGTERVRGSFSKPLLDPGTRGNMSSKLLEYLTSKAAPGELETFSLKDLKKFGFFMGIGPNDLQRIVKDPRLASMRIGYSVSEPSRGKKQINLIGDTDRIMETFKGFSTLHKGTLQQVSDDAVERFLPAKTRETLAGLGTNREHTVYTSGDMLKKGAGFFGLQMESGYKVVTGDRGWKDTLGKFAGSSFMNLGDSGTARFTGAVIQGLAGSKATAEEAGMVLAPIFNRGGSGSGQWLGGINAPHAVERKDIVDAINKAFGADKGGQVIASAARGVGIGAATSTHGAGVGDYALGRGSVEPRFFSIMTHKLRAMGLGTKQTSDFLAGVYRNKIGYGDHLKAAGGMVEMAESVAGMRKPVTALQGAVTDLSTFKLKDVANMALEMKSGGFSKFMADNPNGFMLDLVSGAENPAERVIAANAADVFRQGQIFVPGESVLNAMRGTVIKTATDNKSIEDEYSRMMTNFIDDLATMGTNTDKAKANAAKRMAQFKDDVMGMAGKVIHQVSRGKVRGLQSQVAAIYDLNHLTNFGSSEKGELARNIFKKTRGMSVFQDSAGFLSQLNDFMGGDLSSGQAAKKAEMFFTTLERPGAQEHLTEKSAKSIGHKAKGLVSLATRHPFVGLGNVAVVQSFRHVEEVGMGAEDATFKAFTETKAGEKYASIGGFQNLVKGGKKGAAIRKSFFRDFVGSLGEFAGEGGGMTYFPQQKETVSYNGSDMKKGLSVDFGFSQAAIGDWDGDQWQMMMLDKKGGHDVMTTLGSENHWLENEQVYKIKSELFTAEAKGGLSKHAIASGMPDVDGLKRIQQDIMKEYGAKNLVGNLDVQLNKVRYAILDLSMDNPKQARMAEEAMSMLKVMQEHTVIKGKKLPVFREFAEMLTGSVKTMFDGGGVESFRRVLKDEVFVGSNLWREQGGVSVTGVGPSASPTVQAAVTTMKKQPVVIDDTIDFLFKAVNRAITTGVSDAPSHARLAMAMGSDNPVDAERHMNAIRAAVTHQGGMIAGAGDKVLENASGTIEHAFSSIRSAASRMDRKTQALFAMGGMAALGVGALVSNEGYGATPLVGDMETIGAATRSSIEAGNLLRQQGGQGPSPEQMQQGIDPYAMMGRPINTPTTYMNKGSSYQVRGEINSGGGLSTLNNYMSSLGGGGGGGSVRINDARRPITQNYLDRLSGEY